MNIEAVPGADLAEATTLALPDMSGAAEMIDGDAQEIANAIHALLEEKGFV